jgi:hypothetical protein
MRILGVNVQFPTWSRDKNGKTFSDIGAHREWSSFTNNLHIAQNHPILTPALLFESKLFSQAKFEVIRESSGKVFKNADILKLLNKPNHHQTLPDLLESLEFTRVANGVGVLYTKRNIAFPDEINSLYVLDYGKITFPDSLDKGSFINASQAAKYKKTEIVYDEYGENLKIKLKDLLFFYDLPNGMKQNPYKAQSRIDGLKQTLINTQDSLIAKNIILKSNGKEIISGTKDGFPLGDDEKKAIEDTYANDYGVAFSRKRGIVLESSVTHKSLHIALRDLGLDESVKVDGNIIFTGMHIPKDILSLEAKKTTYNNFKESMVSYIQNEIQPTLDSFCAVFNALTPDDGLTLKGSYEHLPIMQFILIERYKGIWERGNALLMLRNAGLPDENALDMVGLDNTIKLNELSSQKPNEEEDAELSEKQEQQIRNLIHQEL